MKHAWLIAAIILICISPAHAFMCTAVGKDGPAISWAQRTVYYTLDSKGTSDIPGDQELKTLRQAFDVWNDVDCSDFKFVESGNAYDGKVGFDYLNPGTNQNALLFHDIDWPYSSLIIALTSVTVNNCTGQILDADIEFNSHHYKFTTTDNLISTDLLNTAVHEIGHMLGLDHTNDTNNVMYPYANTGDTRCRQLFQDDIDAICFKYPLNGPVGYCADNNNCKDNCRAPGNCEYDISTVVEDVGCQGAGGAGPTVILWLLLLTIFRQSYYSLSRRHRPNRE